MSLDQRARDVWAEVREQVASIERPKAGVIARRSRRGRMATGLAALTVLALAGVGVTVALQDDPAPTPVQVTDDPETTTTSGGLFDRWFALATGPDLRSDVYLVREGEPRRRVELPGSDTADEECPAFAPATATSDSDAERLMIIRRATDDAAQGDGDAELVIVEVDDDGSVSPEVTIPLDGLGVVQGDVPCAIWSPDGNWAALGGAGAVWVVNTTSGEVSRLPGYQPTDLEWRPGTDELAITGEEGVEVETRPDYSTDTPVTLYTASSGEIRTLGSARASHLTWSPDGTTLAFIPEDQPEDNAPFTTMGPDGRTSSGGSGIWLVNADGTNQRQLTEHSGWLARPGPALTWSPDGDLIAFLRQIPFRGEPHEVVLVTATDDDADNPIGTERVIVSPNTGTPSDSSTPADPSFWYPVDILWSPDGTYLLYFQGNGVLAVPMDTAGQPIVITDVLDIPPLTDDDLWSLRWAP